MSEVRRAGCWSANVDPSYVHLFCLSLLGVLVMGYRKTILPQLHLHSFSFHLMTTLQDASERLWSRDFAQEAT